jgi:hypothetical protein
MKADYLGKVIEYFDPMLSLDARHSAWYVERPDSPHLEMKALLLNTTADSKTLFSGHQGSGKTSTLNKLAADPDINQKFFIVQFSIKDELNIADLTYTDLLVAMGGRLYAVAEEALRLNGKLKKDLDDWSAEVSRVWSKTDQAEVGVEGGIGAFFLRAKGLLKTGFEDKKEFRVKFEPRIPQLIEIINRIIAAIETHPEASNQEVLLIIDDLDKPTVDVAMDLFFSKGPILAQPECKIIFTVPTSLLYSGQYNVVKRSFGEPFILPSFKIKEKNGEPNDLAWGRMREIVERRLDKELIASQALDDAVEMSGGVVRELVRIIQSAAARAVATNANSIQPPHVEHAVNKLRMEYNFSLTRQEYIDILKQVHETKLLRYTDERPLLDLLHNLFILQYPNMPGWYGVNPIVHELIGV